MVRSVVATFVPWVGTTTAVAPELVTLATGRYHAVLPTGWSPGQVLPVVFYLHGYGQDSARVTADRRLVAAITSLGALMIVPGGVDKTRCHVGAPLYRRDDIAFLHAILVDVERRWPVDKTRIFAAGFSIGGSMVWDLACRGAEGGAAFLSFSGDFWLPYPERCETAPFDLRHTRAVDDHTFPMAGRALGGRAFHQGNVEQGFNILEAADGCAAIPDSITREGDLDCRSWTKYGSGKELELCLDDDDHQIQPEWLHHSVEWALDRVAAKG